MKKILTLMLIAALIMGGMASCKKNDSTPKTTLQKIQAKWQLVSYQENDHYSGMDHIQNLTGGPDDYLDFRTDGKVYVSFFGTRDTSVYALSGDTKVVMDGSFILDIKTLTDNSFILYSKDVFGADYYEQTFTLKK